MAMEFSEAVDFTGCKEDEVQGPSGMLQCNFILCSSLSCKRGSILMKYDPFLKKKTSNPNNLYMKLHTKIMLFTNLGSGKLWKNTTTSASKIH